MMELTATSSQVRCCHRPSFRRSVVFFTWPVRRCTARIWRIWWQLTLTNVAIWSKSRKGAIWTIAHSRPQRLVVLWPSVIVQGYKSETNESGWVDWSSKQSWTVGIKSREMVEAQMRNINTGASWLPCVIRSQQGKSTTNVNCFISFICPLDCIYKGHIHSAKWYEPSLQYNNGYDWWRGWFLIF